MPLYTGNIVIVKFWSTPTSTGQKGHFILGIVMVIKLQPCMIIIINFSLLPRNMNDQVMWILTSFIKVKISKDWYCLEMKSRI